VARLEIKDGVASVNETFQSSYEIDLHFATWTRTASTVAWLIVNSHAVNKFISATQYNCKWVYANSLLVMHLRSFSSGGTIKIFNL